MLRLPSTTLSLTMTEVKEFERHSRFKKYLAKEGPSTQLPIRTKNKAVATQNSRDSEHSDANHLASSSEATSTNLLATDVEETPGLLVRPPRCLPKPDDDSAESSSQGITSSLQRGASSSLDMPPPTGWGNLPTPLPPPFSREKRSISDAQSLPSVRPLSLLLLEDRDVANHTRC